MKSIQFQCPFVFQLIYCVFILYICSICRLNPLADFCSADVVQILCNFIVVPQKWSNHNVPSVGESPKLMQLKCDNCLACVMQKYTIYSNTSNIFWTKEQNINIHSVKMLHLVNSGMHNLSILCTELSKISPQFNTYNRCYSTCWSFVRQYTNIWIHGTTISYD